MNKKNTRILIISVCILVVLIAAFALIYTAGKQGWLNAPAETTAPVAAQPGDTTPPVALKHLTVRIIADGFEEKTVTVDTDAANLRGALESVDGLISGEESQYGLFVTAVNGIAADSAKQQWWCFTRGGEQLMTGVDDTPVADGETYEATLKTGY